MLLMHIMTLSIQCSSTLLLSHLYNFVIVGNRECTQVRSLTYFNRGYAFGSSIIIPSYMVKPPTLLWFVEVPYEPDTSTDSHRHRVRSVMHASQHYCKDRRVIDTVDGNLAPRIKHRKSTPWELNLRLGDLSRLAIRMLLWRTCCGHLGFWKFTSKEVTGIEGCLLVSILQDQGTGEV